METDGLVIQTFRNIRLEGPRVVFNEQTFKEIGRFRAMVYSNTASYRSLENSLSLYNELLARAERING